MNRNEEKVNPENTKYVLRLTPEQARVTRDALELYARLKIGQFEQITELTLDVRNANDYCTRREFANSLLKEVACIIFGQDQYGQPGCKRDRFHYIAWNIYTTIRYYMAWNENPAGGMGVSFDKPYSYGGEPVPECEIINTEGNKKDGCEGCKHEDSLPPSACMYCIRCYAHEPDRYEKGEQFNVDE